MSSSCLSFSTKILQHHAFFQNSFFPLPHGLHTWLHNASSLEKKSKLQPCVLTCSSMVRGASRTIFKLFIKKFLQLLISYFLDRLVSTYGKKVDSDSFPSSYFLHHLSKNNGVKNSTITTLIIAVSQELQRAENAEPNLSANCIHICIIPHRRAQWLNFPPLRPPLIQEMANTFLKSSPSSKN